jgi:hypothetical protein
MPIPGALTMQSLMSSMVKACDKLMLLRDKVLEWEALLLASMIGTFRNRAGPTGRLCCMGTPTQNFTLGYFHVFPLGRLLLILPVYGKKNQPENNKSFMRLARPQQPYRQLR